MPEGARTVYSTSIADTTLLLTSQISHLKCTRLTSKVWNMNNSESCTWLNLWGQISLLQDEVSAFPYIIKVRENQNKSLRWLYFLLLHSHLKYIKLWGFPTISQSIVEHLRRGKGNSLAIIRLCCYSDFQILKKIRRVETLGSFLPISIISILKAEKYCAAFPRLYLTLWYQNNKV